MRPVRGVAVLMGGAVALAACGVATTEPRAINRSIPSTAAPNTTTYPVPGRPGLVFPVALENVVVKVYFVRSGRLDERLRSVSIPQIPEDRDSADVRRLIETDRKQAIVDALLAGPNAREREEGSVSALEAVLDLTDPSPVVVSSVDPGNPIVVNLRVRTPPGERERVMQAYAQLVWSIDPDNGRGVLFQAFEGATPRNLNPPRETDTAIPQVYGSDFPCLRFGDCAEDDATADDTPADTRAGA